MDVRNCRSCGRIFNYIGGIPICPSCANKLEEKFAVVKKYIRDNPNAQLVEISEVTETPVTQIRQWIREERLSFTKDSVIGIECEGCGVTIKTGKYCERCKNEVMNSLNSAYHTQGTKEAQKEEKKSTINKMRFLNRDKI